MALDDLDLVSLQHLVQAGVLCRAQAIRQKAGWRIVVYYGRAEHALATQHGRVRIFKTLDKVVTYLTEVGVTHFDVDASFNPRIQNRMTGLTPTAAVSGEPKRVVSCSEELQVEIKKAIKAINNLGD